MSAAARVTGGGENQRTPRRIGELRVSSIMMSSPRRIPAYPAADVPEVARNFRNARTSSSFDALKGWLSMCGRLHLKGRKLSQSCSYPRDYPLPPTQEIPRRHPLYSRVHTPEHTTTHTNTNKHAALCGRVTRPAAGCAPSTRACPPRADRRARRLRSRTGSATRRPRAPAAARPKA